MKLSKTAVKALESVHKPGISPAKLAKRAKCPEYQAYLFIGQRKFEEAVLALHRQGVSSRRIAELLGSNHTQVLRTLWARQADS